MKGQAHLTPLPYLTPSPYHLALPSLTLPYLTLPCYLLPTLPYHPTVISLSDGQVHREAVVAQSQDERASLTLA
jgi:hypothetical protein